MAADPNPTPLTRGDSVVEEARKFYRVVSEYEGDARDRFLEDYKFANGDSHNNYQWPNAVRRQRDIDNRPCLTINVVRQHNNQISNTARKAKSEPKILAMGNGATQESANMLKQIIRHIEYQSDAQSAYTVAREFQVDAGWGWWRLTTDYAAEDTFDQEIFIRPVMDPLSVFMDPDCQRLDCSDARKCLVFSTMIPKDLFNEMYPQYGDVTNIAPLGINNVGDNWIEQEHVMLAEYFRKVSYPDTVVNFLFEGQRYNVLRSQLPPSVAEEVLNDTLTRTRKTFRDEIEWYLIAGEQIIDQTIWPGKYIPLIRVLGRQTVIEGRLDRPGHTRSMISAQHMFNWNAALSIHTRIPTPTGWTTMGQLQTGDLVFDQDGHSAEIKQALPIRLNEDCYKITFDNGHSVVTDAGHIWAVEERVGRNMFGYVWNDTTVSTIELTKKKHFIRLAKPLALPDVDLPIDAYLLGMWLGDGQSSGATIYSHVDDVEEERYLISNIGYVSGTVKSRQGNGAAFSVEKLNSRLRDLNLLNNKHIPEMYLRGSYHQRLALLQGLMDTDGHFAPNNNQCVFVNNNPAIVRNFLELCASLEIKATVDRQPPYMHEPNENNVIYISKQTYRVSFTADPDTPVFRLERKYYKQTKLRTTHWRRTKRLGIVSVERVESVPVRCIMLDTPEHLYLCSDGMIPTHNSSAVEFGATQGKTPWVAPAKAIEEFETYWNTANTQNHSVLPWNHVDDQNPDVQIPPPIRVEPPNFAPLYEKGMETAFNQMMMASGQWQNQMGMMGNERTGRAIAERQEQSDTSTYHFQDNYESALVYSTKQLIDLIPRIYDTRRVLMIQAEDGLDYELTIDPGAAQAYAAQRAFDGRIIQRIFNPKLGMYQVAASFGPATGSARQQTADALTLILTQNPGLTGLIGDLLLKSFDFDAAQEAAERLRRMVPPQALGQGPSPEVEQLQQVVQLLQQNLAKAIDQGGKDRLKLVGKDQMRDIDAYKAETDRMKALADMLPMDAQGLQQIIEQLVQQSLDTKLTPIVNANAQGVGEQSEGGQQPVEQEQPPMPGAQKAPDGEWYLADPTRRGRYLKIAPLAQERTQRSVISNA